MNKFKEGDIVYIAIIDELLIREVKLLGEYVDKANMDWDGKVNLHRSKSEAYNYMLECYKSREFLEETTLALTRKYIQTIMERMEKLQ